MTRWDRITLALVGLVTLSNELPYPDEILTARDAVTATTTAVFLLAFSVRLIYVSWSHGDD